jgi:hypothetical protein
MNWFYDIPVIFSFLLFVTFIVLVALAGLFLTRLLPIQDRESIDHNTFVGIFISVIAVFLGIILTFIIVGVLNNYNDAQLDSDNEAYTIYLLYQVVAELPGTEATQQLIIEYLEYIINEEYPALNQGITPPRVTDLTDALRDAILDFDPTTDQETVLYGQSIMLFEEAGALRVRRLVEANNAPSDLLTLVTVLDSILLIIMCWLLYATTIIHYIVTAIVGIYVGSALYLSIILASPFRGAAGLTASPFILSLASILE